MEVLKLRYLSIFNSSNANYSKILVRSKANIKDLVLMINICMLLPEVWIDKINNNNNKYHNCQDKCPYQAFWL